MYIIVFNGKNLSALNTHKFLLLFVVASLLIPQLIFIALQRLLKLI